MDVRPIQQEGGKNWYWQPRQLVWAKEMDLGGEPIVITLQNQHNP